MDDEGQDGPLTFWQMFNTPTIALFKNLDHAIDGLERLLMSVLKSTREFSEVLVPRRGVTQSLEDNYLAFDLWFIGRIYYILSIKNLERIHTLSKEAQLKILYILYINGEKFFSTFEQEYISLLDELVNYYKRMASNPNNNDQKITLKYFTPSSVNLQTVDLDLTPIHVEVSDIDECRYLMDYTLQILAHVLARTCTDVNVCKAKYEAVFDQMLDLLENYAIEVKIFALNFYTELIGNSSEVVTDDFCKIYPSIYRKLLESTEALVSSLDIITVDKNNQFQLIERLQVLLEKLLRIIQYCSHGTHCTMILSNICVIIINHDNKKRNALFEYTKVVPDSLKRLCLRILNNSDVAETSFPVDSLQAEELSVVSDYFKQKIVDYAINIDYENTNLVTQLNNCYSYRVLCEACSILNATLDANLDEFVIQNHMNKCRSVLKILTCAQVEYNISLRSVKTNRSTSKNLYSSEFVSSVLNMLIKMFNLHKNSLLRNEYMLSTMMDILLGVAMICNVNQFRSILNLTCLQIDTSSGNLDHLSQKVGLQRVVLVNMLVQNLICTVKFDSDWKKHVSTLLRSISRIKNNDFYEYVIQISPLLLFNKVFSPSKLVSEYLHPALSNGDQNVHEQLVLKLPIIICIALGETALVQVAPLNKLFRAHSVHKSEMSDLRLICSKCHGRHNHTDFSILWKFDSSAATSSTVQMGIIGLFEKFLANKLYACGVTGLINLIVTCSQHNIFSLCSANYIWKVESLQNVVPVIRTYVNNILSDEKMEDSKREIMFSTCFNILLTTTKASLDTNNIALQNTTLDCIREFGMVTEKRVILPSTKLLVFFLMHPQCTLGSQASLYLQQICEAHGGYPNKMYHRYKKDYCRQFVTCSLCNGQKYASSILKVVRAFGFVGYRDFMSKDVHHFLPYLLPFFMKIKYVKTMIEEISSLIQCTPSDFLIERFPHIYTHVYLYESDEVAAKTFEFIESMTGTTIPHLVKKHFRVILTELLLQYCCGPEKVLNSCKWLAQNDPDQPNLSSTSQSLTMSQIADFIEPRFLGVLAYFDNKLVNAKVALSVKRKALQSFPDIIKLMGSKYITPLRFKVLATLRSALSLVEEFPKILAQAWSAFIHNIDTITLGPLLTTLSMALLQQLNHAPVEINKIFQFLILSNENLLSTYIPDLFFLEESNVSDRVKSVVSRHVKMTQPEPFLAKVKWFLKYLGQDISDVRYYAMKHIDRLLRKSRKEIHNAVFGGKAIDPIIVDLLDHLNKLCTESDGRVQVWSARCLGQLGALETGLLPRSYSQLQAQPFPFIITQPIFATAALVELTRACQYENDTKNMDCYALTIQEILKVYDISPSGENKDIWASFPDHMHQIMLPLLSSRYTLAFPTRPKKTHPLFGSRHASTFVEWAFNWAGQLVSLAADEGVQELLRTVLPSMRRDYSTLVLFLPYVLLHAIISNNDSTFIREEIMAVIGLEAFEEQRGAAYEAKYKMLRNIFMTPTIATTTVEESTQMKCCKMMYVLLDFLNRWLLEWSHTQTNPLLNTNYKMVNSFVESFCKRTIARGNFLCGEYERALQYLERYMEESPERMQEQLSLLAEMYAVLDEPDAVAGILTIKRSEPSLDELILAHEVTGRLQDAAVCYERLAQEQKLTPQGLQGMVECYLGLDQPFTAHQLLLEQAGCDTERMLQLAAEPYWRLGMFEQLDNLVNKPIPASEESWGMVAGRCVLSVRAQDGLLSLRADEARRHLVARLGGGAGRHEGTLCHAYSSLLAMHTLAEMEHADEIISRLKELSDGEQSCIDSVEELLGEWKYRICLVDSSTRTNEPLLRMRRILLDQTKKILEPTHPQTAVALDAHIGNIWLQSAKIARKADNFQQAYIYILNAEKYKPERLFIEKAKLYWARGQHEPAFTTLKRGLEEHFPVVDRLRPEQKKLCAKAKLLIASYNDETTNVDMDVNVSDYKAAVDVYRQWEKSLVSLAVYYEKVIGSGADAASQARRLQALSCYGSALLHGHRHLYQSMPRMLSIWLDYEIIPSDPNSIATLTQMSQIIESYAERLPLYLFLTAFSQIVSRICHPIKEVYTQLKAIIVRLIVAYPQHTLWMMMMVVQSGYATRARRCQDVFAHPRLKEPHLLQLIHHFTQLAVKLIELCNKPITGNVTTTQVSTLVRSLPRLLSSDTFSHIMMPFEQFCKVVLPSKVAAQDQSEFKVSMEPEVYIAGIEEQVTILPSLQRPRKVTLRGSDGKPYIIMLKPKDDLRKDFRLMEFNGVVNGFLARDAAARARRLYIRTYAVFPLNEECGLIQWVPNLLGFRPILTHIYKQKGMYTGTRELREMMCSSKDPVSRKLAVFTEQLLPRHPPIFPEWFRKTFSDPYGWYQARSAYIRTTAVMSMVGYILGLGDRHGENILLDGTNGDCVHVDFNCLFNKGEAFEWAECVPFRLTHNMEAAMGPLGREGMYRKSCEVTMRALRSQAAPLLSVIRPFLYDPLVSWHKAGGRAAAIADAGSAERVNNQAKEHVHQIEQRLQGMVRNKNKQQSLLLSVEGQVEHLVQEATSVINLCQMYIGWGPFL